MSNKIETISDAKSEIKRLENQLELYLNRKRINFEKTQPQAMKYQDVVVDKSKNIFDKYTHYVIKDNELDEDIYYIQEEINTYEKFIIEEMERLSKEKDITGVADLIVYLRDEEHLRWEDIRKYKYINYSESHIRKIYKDRKKKDKQL